MDFPGGSDGKASVYNAGDLGSTPGSGRSPGEGSGNPHQYSSLGNPMDRGAWSTVAWSYSPWDRRVGRDLATNTFTKMCIDSFVSECKHESYSN